ncbi:MAG: hypothetical protein JO150_14445 [Acidobacteriaceae bacterium]|nr:hypothetical protein [Acidobacteriaceae bacterium]
MPPPKFKIGTILLSSAISKRVVVVFLRVWCAVISLRSRPSSIRTRSGPWSGLGAYGGSIPGESVLPFDGRPRRPTHVSQSPERVVFPAPVRKPTF